MPNPFEAALKRLELTIQQIKPQLIDAIGVEAEKFIDDNFRKGGFQGASFVPWVPTKKPNFPRPHKTLILTATLRRSFKKIIGPDSVTIANDLPYAQIHNDGGDINIPSRGAILNFTGVSGKFKIAKKNSKRATLSNKHTIPAHTIHMPKRQFMPHPAEDNPVLRKMCETTIEKLLIRTIATMAETIAALKDTVTALKSAYSPGLDAYPPGKRRAG